MWSMRSWSPTPTVFQTYVVQVPPTLAAFGGRYLVRSGASEAIEGEPPGRLVILEFPDRAAAKAWRASPAYQAILPIRDASSTSRVYVVDGYEGDACNGRYFFQAFLGPVELLGEVVFAHTRAVGAELHGGLGSRANFGQAGPPAAPGLPVLMKAAQ